MRKIIDIVILIVIVIAAVVFYDDYRGLLTKKQTVEETPVPKFEEIKYPIFQQEQAQVPKTFSGFKKFRYKYTYTFFLTDGAKNFQFQVSLPITENEVQYIADERFSTIKPEGIYNVDGNRTAIFRLPEIDKTRLDIVMEGIALVRTNDLQTVKKVARNIVAEPNIKRYLKSEKFIEADDSYVRAVANQIKGNTKEEILKNIYDYLHDNNFKYVIVADRGARQTLISKQGKCTDYAALMVALCRAKGIPARITTGTSTEEQVSNAGHAWVEAYLDKYGWVTFEPTSASAYSKFDAAGKFIGKSQYSRFDKVPTNYIIAGRNVFTDAHATFETPYFSSDAVFAQNMEIWPIK